MYLSMELIQKYFVEKAGALQHHTKLVFRTLKLQIQPKVFYKGKWNTLYQIISALCCSRREHCQKMSLLIKQCGKLFIIHFIFILPFLLFTAEDVLKAAEPRKKWNKEKWVKDEDNGKNKCILSAQSKLWTLIFQQLFSFCEKVKCGAADFWGRNLVKITQFSKVWGFITFNEARRHTYIYCRLPGTLSAQSPLIHCQNETVVSVHKQRNKHPALSFGWRCNGCTKKKNVALPSFKFPIAGLEAEEKQDT